MVPYQTFKHTGKISAENQKIMTDEDEQNFQNASECHISQKKKTQRKILKSETFVILPGISEDQHIKIVI